MEEILPEWNFHCCKEYLFFQGIYFGNILVAKAPFCSSLILLMINSKNLFETINWFYIKIKIFILFNNPRKNTLQKVKKSSKIGQDQKTFYICSSLNFYF